MTNTYPHTDAVYTEAMDKLRDEMATSKSEGVQALGDPGYIRQDGQEYDQ